MQVEVQGGRVLGVHVCQGATHVQHHVDADVCTQLAVLLAQNLQWMCDEARLTSDGTLFVES